MIKLISRRFHFLHVLWLSHGERGNICKATSVGFTEGLLRALVPPLVQNYWTHCSRLKISNTKVTMDAFYKVYVGANAIGITFFSPWNNFKGICCVHCCEANSKQCGQADHYVNRSTSFIFLNPSSFFEKTLRLRWFPSKTRTDTNIVWLLNV